MLDEKSSKKSWRVMDPRPLVVVQPSASSASSGKNEETDELKDELRELHAPSSQRGSRRPSQTAAVRKSTDDAEEVRKKEQEEERTRKRRGLMADL